MRRLATASRVATSLAYEAVRYWRCGRSIHSHAGKAWEIRELFNIRKGILMINRFISLRLTASKCSQMAWTCQLSTNLVAGCSTGQAKSLKKQWKDLLAISAVKASIEGINPE